MRRASLVLMVLFLSSGCIFSVGSKQRKQAPTHPSWEYKQDVVCVPTVQPFREHQARIESVLAQRGRDGWELVSSSPSTSESETCYLLIFKRETI